MPAITYPQYKSLVFGANRTALEVVAKLAPSDRTREVLDLLLREREKRIVEELAPSQLTGEMGLPPSWEHYRACALLELTQAVETWRKGKTPHR